MDKQRYYSLEPKPFYYWFREISNIPRESCKESQISEYLVHFANERHVECDVDSIGNVLMRLPASYGYENEPMLLLQAHLDMVCNKDEGVEFDFNKDPIRFRFDDDMLYAQGTTLGADNGTGVAVMLSIADGYPVNHPALELLFTVQEEIGLKGIRSYDMSKIQSRRMINFDSGYSHVMCACSAGSIKAQVEKDFHSEPLTDMRGIHININNGKGGHSGIMIDKGRMCGFNAMGDLLGVISDQMPIHISDLQTSQQKGSILSACSADIVCPSEIDLDTVEDLICKTWNSIKARYILTDQEIAIEYQRIAKVKSSLNLEDSKKVIDAMLLYRTGVHKFDPDNRTNIISSSACGIGELKDGKFHFIFSIRSSDNDELTFLRTRYYHLSSVLGLKWTVLDEYAGWLYRPNSLLQEKVRLIHRNLFNEEIEVEYVHGGIEVGVIAGAIPEMDAVGFSPTATLAHTTSERLHINEVLPFWEMFLKILSTKDSDMKGTLQ